MTVDVHHMLRELATLGTVPVLDWLDEDGYPASARVTPGDVVNDGVVIPPLAGVSLVAGPANLMAHSLNARMWDLKSVCFRGRLVEDGGMFRFVPERQIGKAKQGPGDMVRFMRGAIQAAEGYLRRRGLARPKVSYDQIYEYKRRAKELGID